MDAVAPLIGPVVGALVPYLPRLLQLGQGIAEDAAQDLQDEGWSLAKRIWTVLRPKVDAKPAAKEAAQDVAASSTDEDSVAALRLQLRKLLTEDAALREGVARLVQEGERTGAITVTASGARSVAIGGNASGNIVTGDSNRIGS
jgi:hypothetical protein